MNNVREILKMKKASLEQVSLHDSRLRTRAHTPSLTLTLTLLLLASQVCFVIFICLPACLSVYERL